MAPRPPESGGAASASGSASASLWDGPVSILRTCSISPSSSSPPSPLYLSNADIFFKDIHYNRRLLFFPDSPNPELAIPALKLSLSQVLVSFYPWAGRLAPDPAHHGRLSIHLNHPHAGVSFVEASVDVDMSQIRRRGFPMMPLFDRLAQQLDHTGDSLYTSPLLSVQVTTFRDGGLALGITQSHIVADGQSLWHFMVAWGECARGVGIKTEPLHERERLALREEPSEEIAKRFEDGIECKMEEEEEEEEEEEADGGNDDDGAEEEEEAEKKMELVQCVLDVKGEAIKKLKEEAGGGYTSFEVVCAHLWQRVDAARRSGGKETTAFWVLVNMRSRMRPALPPNYFGNTIELSMATTRTGQLRRDGGLGRTAERVRRAARACDHESMWAMIHWLELNDKSFTALGKKLFMAKDSINVASSPRFPAYDVDFGWGVAEAVRSAKVPGNGEMVLFGGRPGSGAGDLEICFALPPSPMKRLLADPSFLPTPRSNPFLYYYSTS